MTAYETIQAYLKRSANKTFCDDCLSQNLAIKPRQQVQQKTFKIAQEPFFQRKDGECSACSSTKLVISFRAQ